MKFEQYADDGWGEYHDSVSWPFRDEMPDFFSEYQMDRANKSGHPWQVMKDHGPDDVDVVVFKLEM